MATIQELKEWYKGEWLAIELVGDSQAEPQDGELVYHSSDHDDVWRSIKGDKRRIYVTFAGPALAEGHAAAF